MAGTGQHYNFYSPCDHNVHLDTQQKHNNSNNISSIAPSIMPKENTSLFADSANKQTPFHGNTTHDDLNIIHAVLTPLLLSIPYDLDGLHILVGIIKPMQTYSNVWHAAFPIPPCPLMMPPCLLSGHTWKQATMPSWWTTPHASFKAAQCQGPLQLHPGNMV
jgi:hypothetical protein